MPSREGEHTAGPGGNRQRPTPKRPRRRRNPRRQRPRVDQQTAQRKPATDKIEPAAKKLTEAEAAVKRAEQTRAAADTEITLSKSQADKSAAAVNAAKTAIDASEAARVKADADLQAARKAVTEADKPLRSIAFSPDNLTVATTGDDQLVHTWNASNGAAFEVLAGHKGTVTALAFTPGGELVSAAQDRAVVVWDANPPWKLERTIGSADAKSPFTDRVCALAFSADGKLLATGGGEPSRGGEIKLWNAATGELARDIPNIHSDVVLGLDFSPDGNLLASAAADKMARLTNLAEGKLARTFRGPHAARPRCELEPRRAHARHGGRGRAGEVVGRHDRRPEKERRRLRKGSDRGAFRRRGGDARDEFRRQQSAPARRRRKPGARVSRHRRFHERGGRERGWEDRRRGRTGWRAARLERGRCQGDRDFSAPQRTNPA